MKIIDQLEAAAAFAKYAAEDAATFACVSAACEAYNAAYDATGSTSDAEAAAKAAYIGGEAYYSEELKEVKNENDLRNINIEKLKAEFDAARDAYNATRNVRDARVAWDTARDAWSAYSAKLKEVENENIG